MYSDFGSFRDAAVPLEAGKAGSRFPTLILHSDCDGEWTPEQSVALETELKAISAEFAVMPTVPLDGWKLQIAKLLGLRPASLYECFFDVDGEPLLERLLDLSRLSQSRNLPIIFQ